MQTSTEEIRCDTSFLLMFASFAFFGVAFMTLALLTSCDSGSSRSLETNARSDFEKGLAYKDGHAIVGTPFSSARYIERYLGVTEYGNGVYYFPHRGEKFGKALSLFSKYHPELTSICVAGDNEGNELGGSTRNVSRHKGYWVIYRPLPEEK